MNHQLELFDDIVTDCNVNYISNDRRDLPFFIEYNEDSQSLQEIFSCFGVPQEIVCGNTPFEVLKVLSGIREYHRLARSIIEICTWFGEQRMSRGQVYKCSQDIYNHFQKRLQFVPQELFIVLLLNNRHEYLVDKVVSIGILNKCLIHPRETYSFAMEYRASAIICVHNHPSGGIDPSEEDKRITNRLIEVGKIIGIPLLDHLIIGDGYYSFADNGMI